MILAIGQLVTVYLYRINASIEYSDANTSTVLYSYIIIVMPVFSVMKNSVGEHVIIGVNVNDTTVATHSD